MKIFLIRTFLFSWIIWGLVLILELNGILKATLMNIALLGPGIGALITSRNNRNITISRYFIYSTILILLAYLLRILRPNIIINEFSFSLITEHYWSIIFVSINIVLGGFLLFKANVFENSSGRNFLIGILFFPIIFILGNIISTIIGIPVKPDAVLEGLSLSQYVVIFLMTTPYWILIGGGIEELGWRPVLQQRLQTKYNPLLASIYTGIIWSIWHLPLYAIRGEEITILGLLNRISFSILLSIILIYFFNKSKSTLQVILLHGMSNACIMLLPIHKLFYIIILTVFVVYFIWNGKMWKKIKQ